MSAPGTPGPADPARPFAGQFGPTGQFGPAGQFGPTGPAAGAAGGSLFRPPRDCPVCTARLDITQLGCPNCGTGLSGRFRPCEFCGLDDADRDVLRVFLTSRGNMKDLERHLGVSYPTARARFDDLLRKLGLAEPSAASGSGGGGRSGRGSVPPDRDSRLETLRALAEGDLDVDAARQLLTGEQD